LLSMPLRAPMSKRRHVQDVHVLDAAFYDPLVLAIRRDFRNANGRPVGAVARVSKPSGRHKTNYVASEYGIPYLSGRQLLQHRPINLRSISPRSLRGAKPFRLAADWIAYQADGRAQTDLGEPVMVTSDREGWLASGHVGRVIPNDRRDAGWIYLALRCWQCQAQLKSTCSGSVVDSTYEADMESVVLPPPIGFDPVTPSTHWDRLAEANRYDSEAFCLVDERLAAVAVC
jgi:type I restriction enzyme S subunit